MSNVANSAKIKLSDIAGKVEPRTSVFVEGIVEYSHISSKIAGEELKKANSYTKYPSADPYFKISIQITESDRIKALEYDDTNNSEKTLAMYLYSKLYTSNKPENQGKFYFTATSKGNEIRVYQKGSDGKLHKVALNGNELAQGSKVKLELNYFKSTMGAGVGLNAVIIEDAEIKVYQGGGVKGYETADDVISLPARQNVVNDTADVEEAEPETTQAAPAVDDNPIGAVIEEGTTPSLSYNDLEAMFRLNS